MSIFLYQQKRIPNLVALWDTMHCTAFSSCRLCHFLLWCDTLSFSAMLKPEPYISCVSKKTIHWFDMLWKGVIIWIFKHSGRWKIWAVCDGQRSDPARLDVSSLGSTTMASCSFPLMCCQLELVNENERGVFARSVENVKSLICVTPSLFSLHWSFLKTENFTDSAAQEV